MPRPRYALALVWFVVVALPLLVLAGELVRRPAAWSAWAEANRILPLLRNSVLLALGAVALTLPPGTLLGFLLYRTDLPGRFALRRVLVPAMFVPLPLVASAWQATLNALGFGPALPAGAGLPPAWAPWGHGLTSAILVHAAAGLPWIVWLTGQGFCAAPHGAEEDALLHGGPWAALRRVTLPQAMPAVAAAALWVALQTATEVSVTDVMQVRTFAEEVYTQFSRPDPDESDDLAMARALAVAVPPALGIALLATWMLWSFQRNLSQLAAPAGEWPLLRLRRLRIPAALGTAAVVGALLGVPLLSLLHKAGAVPPADAWDAGVAGEQTARAWQAQSGRIASSLLWALVTGLGVAALVWLSGRSPRRGGLINPGAMIVLVVLWCLPGPVLGLGLKEAIDRLVDAEEALSGGRVTWLRQMLYDGPSPAPVMWAAALRFIPCAAALLWPALRRVPRDLEEQARADGATRWHLLRHVAWPATAPAAARAALVVAALAVGELSAGKLVQTPGGQTFASEIFNQIHFGLSNHLAAMCLLLLAMIAFTGVLVTVVGRLFRDR